MSERSQCTRVDNTCSSFQFIRSGIIQGRCLWPIVFLVFINDSVDILQAPVRCKLGLYADDVKLFTEIKSIAVEHYFQNCLDHVHLWSVKWQLTISSKKCCIFNLGKPLTANDGADCHLETENIIVSDSVPDLAVTMDPYLCFSEHIVKFSRKAHQRANLIHRWFLNKQRDLLVKVYKTIMFGHSLNITAQSGHRPLKRIFIWNKS